MKSYRIKSQKDYKRLQSIRMTSLKHEYPLSPWHADVFNEFKPYLKAPVVDIGTRNGLLLDELEKAGYEAHGIEITDLALHAQEMGRKVVQADIHLGVPFADKFFKSAIITHALEHFHSPEKALLEVKRILDGHIFIIFPGQSPNEQMRDNYGHFSFFADNDDVCELLKKVGFEIVSAYSKGGSWNAVIAKI